MLALVCLAVLLGGLANPASAEKLVSDISAREISITSNFTGTEVVVFGTIERDEATVPRRGDYDIAVTIVGPLHTAVSRRKDRVLGIWVNRESRTFFDVPSFYAVHSTRPLEEIAIAEVLAREQIGLNHLVLPAEASGGSREADTAPFREALLRLKQKDGLFAERPGSVEFLSSSLFRTTVPLPANVPVGTYQAHAYLFGDGVVVARLTYTMDIAKTGFEQLTYTLAHQYAFFYGIGAVILAIVTGWLAGVIFRKD
ncbi:MAG: TIGR02186 family protein [Hyphomicrobiales bacterium]|nr:MAG: TIGR02186 family protein [Hyphomicrobiales bacterium]